MIEAKRLIFVGTQFDVLAINLNVPELACLLEEWLRKMSHERNPSIVTRNGNIRGEKDLRFENS